MNENEYLTPTGDLLRVVVSDLAHNDDEACALCYFRDRGAAAPNHCYPDTLPAGEPPCDWPSRADGRHVYWALASSAQLGPEPNPL